MTEDDIVLNIKNLQAGYNGNAIISGLDIKLQRGETVCLIGPNGSGKSTVLKTVTGQLARMDGSIDICGIPAESMSAKEIALYISVVLTDRVAPELMTCMDVAAMGRYPHTGRMGLLHASDRKKVAEALEMVNADDIAYRLFNEISDGQRQRVMLARAICQEAALIVLDEPVSFLDIRHKLEIMTVLKRLARAKEAGILMSVHELGLARAVADYVICLKDGGVFAEGSPEEIFRSRLIAELYDLEMAQYDECLQNIKII